MSASTRSPTPIKTIGHIWPSLPTTPSTICSRGALEGRDADAGVHIGQREVHQVAAVVAAEDHVPVKIFCQKKNPDLIRFTGLQFVEEFSAPLLPHFLSIWCKTRPLDDYIALHKQILLYCLHCPWVHAVWRQVPAVIKELFNFENQVPDAQVLTNLGKVLSHGELLSNELVVFCGPLPFIYTTAGNATNRILLFFSAYGPPTAAAPSPQEAVHA
jgi:hypothetical protein